MRVLLVEDETDLGNAIKRVLAQESYIVDWVVDGNTAWDYLDCQMTQYTLGIFDWLLPGISGLELLQRLRQQKNPLPVLMLTAKDTMENKITGLDAGADDYLIKPFHMAELLARLRALQRRAPQFQAAQLQVGNLTLDYKSNTVSVTGSAPTQQVISLTSKEFQFLEYLMRHPQQIVTTDQLLTQLWELDVEPNSNVVAAQVRLLRRKLAHLDCDRCLQTVYRLGYRFNPYAQP